MKVDERKIDVTSTLSGEKIGMTIDDSALAHIMSVLTDLYSDPELAVIREYSTNAFDSHVEAGVTRPIEVTLPAPLSPFFRVRDFGIGMTVEDIRNIYSRYGTSTKRNSNDVVGMLGLGCKSALTYTDQFTLTGIRDGVMTQVSVSRDANGAGSMTIVAQEKTTEPNGVEIIVPAKVGNRFEEKATKFFQFWEGGRVLVNGEKPKRVDGLWVADDLLLTKDISENYIVMGNVAYPMPQDYGMNNNYFRSVAFVDIGAVAFTPSREALQMTPKTKETIADLKVRIQKEKDATMQKEIETATTKWDALSKYAEVKTLGFQKDPTWRGLPMETKVQYPTKTDPITNQVSYTNSILTLDRQGYGGKKGYTYTSIALIDAQVNRQLWVVNYPADNITPYKRQKIDIYINQNAITNARKLNLVKTAKIPNEDWIDPSLIHDWNDIDLMVIPKEVREKRSDGRPTGSYTGYVGGSYSKVILAKDIDTTEAIFWVHSYGGRSETFLRGLYPKGTFITLPANRVEKFKRDFPTALNMNDSAKKEAQKIKDGFSKDDILVLKIAASRWVTFFKSLDSLKINDAEFAKIVDLAKRKNASELVDKNKLIRDFITEIPTQWDNPMEIRYPLLTSQASSYTVPKAVVEHTYIYANAVFDIFSKSLNNRNGGI